MLGFWKVRSVALAADHLRSRRQAGASHDKPIPRTLCTRSPRTELRNGCKPPPTQLRLAGVATEFSLLALCFDLNNSVVGVVLSGVEVKAVGIWYPVTQVLDEWLHKHRLVLKSFLPLLIICEHFLEFVL